MVGISRFDVFLINLDPTLGHEIKKTRPCVVVSPNEMNHGNWTIIIAPLTSTIRMLPTHVPIAFQGRHGAVVLDQIRSVDRSRLVKKIGDIDPVYQKDILDRLQQMFAH